MNYKSVYKLKHIMLTIYLQLCHNMLTVIQYYIIIKIKKTKASRKDLKKGNIMKMSEKELMKSEIIKYAMCKIGTKRVSTLDGMTLEYKNKWYNIYVYDNNITLEELEETKEVEETIEKEQYFDTDTLQLKIEKINHCPNQNTCCIVSPFVHCDYNYKSDACIKAHKKFIHDCEQVHKQMKARSNPEWHHVNLETVRNIDIDMLDEKRQRYIKIYKELIKTVNDLHKCKTAATYENRWLRFKQVIADDINYRGTTLYMTRFLDLQISMCNVECGLWPSADEKATSFIKSRRYRCTTLK